MFNDNYPESMALEDYDQLNAVDDEQEDKLEDVLFDIEYFINKLCDIRYSNKQKLDWWEEADTKVRELLKS